MSQTKIGFNLRKDVYRVFIIETGELIQLPPTVFHNVFVARGLVEPCQTIGSVEVDNVHLRPLGFKVPR